MTTWRAVFVSVVVALFASVALASCRANESDDSGGAVSVGGFTAPLVGGGQFDGSTPRARPLAIWFWAPT